MWNLWIWEGRSWRVLATYETRREAVDSGFNSGEPRDTWVVAKADSEEDQCLRDHCTDRYALARLG